MKRKDNRNRVLEKGETQRSDGTYMYRKVIDGKQKCIYARTLNELREKEYRLTNRIATEYTINFIFDNFVADSQTRKESSNEMAKCMFDAHIRNTIGTLNVEDVKHADIVLFYKSLDLRHSTLKVLNNYLMQCFNFAIRQNLIHNNPCKSALSWSRDDKIHRTHMTRAQQDVFEEYLGTYRNEFYKVLFIVMLETGIRFSEARGLLWEDVDFVNGYITINKQAATIGNNQIKMVSTKSDKSNRALPMTLKCRFALMRWQKIYNRFPEYARYEIDGYKGFVFSRGTTLYNSGLNYVLKRMSLACQKICEERNIEDFPILTCHSLRHSCCTRLAESGMDCKILSAFMGHSDINITYSVYTHIDKEAIKEEFERCVI